MSPADLSPAARRLLLETARSAIESWLLAQGPLELACADPELLQPAAAFVSLKRRPRGELRGCVGRTDACDPLVSVVVQSAVAAASEDPRFNPVTRDELPLLAVQISVLGPLQVVRPEEVEVGRHGLLLRHHGRSGLLLPQVACEYRWDRETFLSWTCRKAGLPPDAWRDPDCGVHAFTALVFSDEDRAADEE